MTTTPTIPCPRCSGTGTLAHAAAQGRALKAERIRRLGRGSHSAVARLLHIQPPYLCDLESGARRFSAARLVNYMAALAKLEDAK